MYIKIDDKPRSAFSPFTTFSNIMDNSEIGSIAKATKCTCGCWNSENEKMHCYVTERISYISKVDCIEIKSNKDIKECCDERLS